NPPGVFVNRNLAYSVKNRYKNICLSYGLVVLTSVPEEYIPETPPSEDRETPEPE
ncbi:MAG: hypothetical protein HFH90_13610, partial [Lachnospiraceae bacterium]|nr:hypothetical protein [Lachnospiraceae bacterium]